MLQSVTVVATVFRILLFLNTSKKSLADSNANYNDPATSLAPFQVSIQSRNSSNQFKHQCFGTIIHEQIVLTAAHCFLKTANPASYTIVVGSEILNTTTMENRYNVTQIVKHKYFYPLEGYDIALAKLQTNLAIDEHLVDKVSFNSAEYLESGQQGYAIGRNQVQTSAGDPQLALIPHRTIDNRTCRKNRFIHVTKMELCAVAFKSLGPCDGDSGSPLLNTDMKIQWGLLSYSRSVCKPNRIYVFTRVQPFVKWIHENMDQLLK